MKDQNLQGNEKFRNRKKLIKGKAEINSEIKNHRFGQ